MSAPVALRILRAARLNSGDTVLIHAAAGGIGHLAVQLAKLLGAGNVIGTARSSRKLDFVRTVGADVAIDYTQPDWPDQIRAAAPDGVDVVLDAEVTPISTVTGEAGASVSIGNLAFPASIAITPDGTKMYVANQTQGTVTPVTLASKAVGSAITVGSQPYAIAITPNTMRAEIWMIFTAMFTAVLPLTPRKAM